MTSDLEASPELEEDGPYEFTHDDDRIRPDRCDSDAHSRDGDDTITARHRQKLTIDVTSSDGDSRGGSSRSDLGQNSPSIASASSPRHLYANNPLRSPGLPASPRHTEAYQNRRN